MALTGKGQAKRRKISTSCSIDLTQDTVDHNEPICLSDSDEDASDGIECLGVSSGKQAEHRKSLSKSINSVLRDASSSSLPHKSLPPLLLTTPEQVAKYTPCSLHFNFLPTELAERLFRAMIGESSAWEVSKFIMNGKHVQSAHTTGFYMKDKSLNGNYWYMGQKTTDIFEESMYFPPAMLEAKKIVDEFVNEELRKGKRDPLEYDGPWEGNVAAANNYKGASGTVGAHSDQMTYLGPAPTIASLSLGVTRNFRLRGVPSLQHPDAPPPRTYDIRLPHNSLCIMKAGCQEHFKHSVPPARSIDLFKLKGPDGKIETFVERINITFRFYRPDFRPESTPVCKCGIGVVLRADAKGKAAAKASEASGVMDQDMRYFWQCIAGTSNEGKSCNYFKLLDMKNEHRGPCIGDAVTPSEPTAGQ